MRRSKRDARDYLQDILSYAEKVQRFTADLRSPDSLAEDEMRLLATVRALEIIGEAVKRLPALTAQKISASSMEGHRGNARHSGAWLL